MYGFLSGFSNVHVVFFRVFLGFHSGFHLGFLYGLFRVS